MRRENLTETLNTTTTVLLLNNSFEVPPRGWDFMWNVYLTLVIWIFMTGVGAHANLRNHLPSGRLSFFLMGISYAVLLRNFTFAIEYREELNPNRTGIIAELNRYRILVGVPPENVGPGFLWGSILVFSFGVSIVGPLINIALTRAHQRNENDVELLMGHTIFCNLNLFLCLSACVLFQPTETFSEYAVLLTLTILIVVILLFPVHPQGRSDELRLIFYAATLELTGSHIDGLKNGQVHDDDYIVAALFYFIYIVSAQVFVITSMFP